MEKGYDIKKLKEKTSRFCDWMLDSYDEKIPEGEKGLSYYINKFKFEIAPEVGFVETNPDYWFNIASYCVNYSALKEKKQEGSEARDVYVIELLTTFGFDTDERKEVLKKIVALRKKREEALCNSRMKHKKRN